MSAVTLTKTPAKATPTCPPWCTAPHDRDTPHYREHRSSGVRPTHGLCASLSWTEPLTEVSGYLGSEPRIYFQIGDASMSLKGWQASDLAAVMDEVDRPGEAELLRDMVARIGDGK